MFQYSDLLRAAEERDGPAGRADPQDVGAVGAGAVGALRAGGVERTAVGPWAEAGLGRAASAAGAHAAGSAGAGDAAVAGDELGAADAAPSRGRIGQERAQRSVDGRGRRLCAKVVGGGRDVRGAVVEAGEEAELPHD